MNVILGCDPLLQPLTGIGHYTNQLGNGLKELQAVETLKLFAHGKFFSQDLLTNLSEQSISTKGKLTKSSLTAKLRTSLASSESVVKLYQTLLPYVTKMALKNYSDHIFHSPNFDLPNFEGKKIVTIHDLSTLRFPEYHPKSRVNFVNNAITNSISEADHIITDSEFVKAELIALLGADKHKISAIPLGADSIYMPRNQQDCFTVINKYALEYKKYFLFVSTIEPRKNLLTLLRSFSLYRKKYPNGLPLILIGGNGWNNQDILNEIANLETKGWVKYLGYVPQNHIPELYSAARSLLFPSIYEGFGLPVLEAIQSGIPVLTCKKSSMSEIVADSAALVELNDDNAMFEAISRFSEDTDWCEKLSNKGLIQAKKFSWERCITDTFKVYKSLV
jgi:alpha-1,3-rhamnosyl/mannosyltransferase